jgi:hypothetical protein
LKDTHLHIKTRANQEDLLTRSGADEESYRAAAFVLVVVSLSFFHVRKTEAGGSSVSSGRKKTQSFSQTICIFLISFYFLYHIMQATFSNSADGDY